MQQQFLSNLCCSVCLGTIWLPGNLWQVPATLTSVIISSSQQGTSCSYVTNVWRRFAAKGLLTNRLQELAKYFSFLLLYNPFSVKLRIPTQLFSSWRCGQCMLNGTQQPSPSRSKCICLHHGHNPSPLKPAESLILIPNPLNPTPSQHNCATLQTLMGLILPCTSEGIKILGAPIGNQHFEEEQFKFSRQRLRMISLSYSNSHIYPSGQNC